VGKTIWNVGGERDVGVIATQMRLAMNGATVPERILQAVLLNLMVDTTTRYPVIAGVEYHMAARHHSHHYPTDNGKVKLPTAG